MFLVEQRLGASTGFEMGTHVRGDKNLPVVIAPIACRICYGGVSGFQRTTVERATLLLLLFGRFENLKAAKEALVYTHHGTCIIEFTAVIGCRE